MPTASGPVAVITGSTRGIGLGIAREMVRLGASAVLCGRSQDRVDDAVASLVADGLPASQLAGTSCDVSDAASVQGLWDFAVERFGRVDHWVNNAGLTTSPIPLHEVPAEQITNVIQANVTGLLFGCKVAAAGMRTQAPGLNDVRGWIWNVEGMGSKGETRQGLATYGTTKAGVGYLMKALRKDLDGCGVHVGAIRPGINITEHFLTDFESLDRETWEKNKKVLNILGDKPETTTPFLAEKILEATKDGTRIQWLTNAKISWRFATAWRNKRDLFAEFENA